MQSLQNPVRSLKWQGLCIKHPYVWGGGSGVVALNFQTVWQNMEISEGPDSLAAPARKDGGIVVWDFSAHHVDLDSLELQGHRGDRQRDASSCHSPS